MMRLSVIKWNVFANLVGTGLVTVLTGLITPLQINILGMEAYGVVGFIATLQMMFVAFDLGLSSTLTRELAADASLGKSGSQDLLSTAVTIYWCSALLVGALIAVFATPISAWWFRAEKLSPQMLVYSLRVIALYLALRWPAALYVGILSGLQRMDVLNVVKVVVSMVRLAGGILVLLHWHILDALLIWTALSAIFEVAAYWFACKRVIPSLSMGPGFSVGALKRVWKFSVSMNALSILTILIVQMDRLVISKLQTLEVLGYYNLAYTVASGIPLVIAAISTAVFPWFTEAQKEHDLALLQKRYIDASWGMLFFVSLIALILGFYGHFLLSIWVSEKAAQGATIPMALLAAGFWFGALVSNAYNVAVARGIPGRPLSVTMLSFLPYTILVIFLVHSLSGTGAALAWLCLSISNVVFLLPFIHRNTLRLNTRSWFSKTLLPLIALGGFSFIPIKLLVEMAGLQTNIMANLAALSVAIALYFAAGYRISPLGNLAKRVGVATEIGA